MPNFPCLPMIFNDYFEETNNFLIGTQLDKGKKRWNTVCDKSQTNKNKEGIYTINDSSIPQVKNK